MNGRHDTKAGTGRGRLISLACATAFLAGCALPDLAGLGSGPGAGSTAPAATAPLAPGHADASPPPASPPPASEAEAACMRQGREQGLTVRQVVGTREVTGSDGTPVARDVMLRIARGEQIFDLRCNYRYAEARARIMSL